MSVKIESPGTYLGKIVESVFGETKNGLPQWVGKIKVTHKYIETKQEIEHFTKHKALDGKPGYVDYSSFDQEITTFQVLYSFKVKREISAETELMAVKQLHDATGWNAPDFASLAKLTGTEIQFTVEFDSYTNPETGKVNEGFKVKWINHKDADPNRQLKALDAEGVAKFSSLVVAGYGSKSAPKAPASFPATTAPKLPPTSPSPTPSTATAASSAASPSVSIPKTATNMMATKPAPAPAPRDKKPAPAVDPQTAAWNRVNGQKGSVDDSVITDGWIAACSAVFGERDEKTVTAEEWNQVADQTIASFTNVLEGVTA